MSDERRNEHSNGSAEIRQFISARLRLFPISSFIVHRSSFIVCCVCFLLLFSSCSKTSKTDKTVLVKVGSRELTKGTLSALAGMPADSLSKPDRVRVVEGWIERALVDMEGQRRHLEKDPEIVAKLAAARSELFRAKLLSELTPSPPSDSVVAAYYKAHQQEFLRPMDTYSIELYWTRTEELMSRFRSQLLHGDTTMIASGDITSEGKWLAEAGELDEDLQKEVTSLKPGEVTFPHPYEDGYRVVRLAETYPAGTVLDLSAVRDEIASRLMVEQGRRHMDSLITSLRSRYPVKLMMGDSL
jgi:hypothetical protein